MINWSQRRIIIVIGVILAVSSTVIAVMNSQAVKSIAFDSLQEKSLSLASDVGANYSKLHNLLKSRKWREADEETTRLMLEVAHRDKPGWENWTDVWIDPESMAKFPCTDLRTINQLWGKSSNKRLSFSVQKRIYEEVGKDWLKFNKRVGWYRQEGVSYDDLTKHPLEGSLPVITRETGVEVFSRANTCKL